RGGGRWGREPLLAIETDKELPKSETPMPSEVTLHLSPHTPVAFPPICCVCLAPATTTHPVQVWMYKVRYPPHLKVTRRYPLPVPYCEAHGRAARHLSRYERGATLALV